MIQLSIKMLPSSGSNQFAYNEADLLVQVRVGREFKLKADYTFMVFNEHLMFMAGESTRKRSPWHHVWRAGHTYSMTMCGCNVWMPGKYFFLMASKDDGCVIRFDLELDDKCCFTVGKPRRCEVLSDEHVLACQVFDARSEWASLCHYDGMAPLRRKALEWLKWNDARADAGGSRQGRRDAFGYNLLVTQGRYNGIWLPSFVAHQQISRMLMMCIPNDRLIVRTGDCSEFYDSENENHNHVLDALFDEKTDPAVDPMFDNYPYQYIEHGDYRLCTVVYVFYNIDAFDNRVMSRLQEVWQDGRHFAIFCGSDDEMDRLLDNYPSLSEHYPEANRVALEEPATEEVVNRVFGQPELMGCQFTPAAIDKLCRMIVTDARQGDLCSADYYASKIWPKPGSLGVIVFDADDIHDDNAYC